MTERLQPAINRQPLQKGVERAVLPEAKERLAKTLGELVAFQTVADGQHQGQFQGLFDYVGSKVVQAEEQIGRKFFRREWNNNGHISTIITPEDPSRSEEDALLLPKIAMLIHADVVGVEGQDELFTVRQDGDTLYGRGVYDMKQGLAIGLDLLPELPVGAALIVTSDEEVGGEHGAAYLAKEVGLKPEFLIVLDGQKSEHLSLGAKAAWHSKVTFHSLLNEGGHGSRYEDYSANELAMDLRNALRVHYPWRYSNSPAGTTFNVGIMEGGVATNKVAQDAHLQVDMRFPSEQEKEQGEENLRSSLLQVVQERLREVYSENMPVTLGFLTSQQGYQLVAVHNQTHEGYVVANVETLARTPLYAIDPNNKLVRRFGEILEEITGEPTKINDKDTGAHDGSNWPETPAIVYMPRGGGAHKSSEWLSAQSLLETREAIGQLLHEELDSNL